MDDGDPTGWADDPVRVPSPPAAGEVAAVLDPFAHAYAGIDPAIVAPLLRWTWSGPSRPTWTHPLPPLPRGRSASVGRLALRT